MIAGVHFEGEHPRGRSQTAYGERAGTAQDLLSQAGHHLPSHRDPGQSERVQSTDRQRIRVPPAGRSEGACRMDQHEQVLIVGAGPVGLLLACELLQQGVSVRLIDGARDHSAHSRATIVWPRLLELMRRTDLTDRIVATGHLIDGVAYFASGKRLGTAWMNRLQNTPYPFAVAIAQSATEELLQQRLDELGGTIDRGWRLTAIGGDARLRPEAVLEHIDGDVQQVATSWLIGADGAHSTVRNLMGASFEGEEFDVSFAITDAEITGDAPMNVVSYCYTPQGSLALGPLDQHVARVAVSVPHPKDSTPPSREFFQSIVDERGPGRNALGELDFSTTFRVHARIAERFQFERCLLVGDAAHVMSPAGAQGMNTGLQDAVNLGWRLGGVLNGRLPDRAISGYDDDRRPAAHAVSQATALQTRWGLLSQRPKIAARNGALRAASASGLLQRNIAPRIAQTAVRYPVAAGTGAAGPTRRSMLRRPASARPGERLPVLLQPPEERSSPSNARRPDTSPALSIEVGGRDWIQIVGDRYTLLLWPGAQPPAGWSNLTNRMRSMFSAKASIVEVSPQSGPLANALGHETMIAIVRPDGHVTALLAPEHINEVATALDGVNNDLQPPATIPAP